MSISAYNSDKEQIKTQVTDIYNILNNLPGKDKIDKRHSYETIYEETVSIRNREQNIFWVTGFASSVLLIGTLHVIFNRKQ
jgi:hypothetical protein|uniref:Uncharacterized protein n=1 Tax=viral metagenome TaxID=1070528 RepID=A0A6C0HMD2_9ZZZZ